MAAEEQAAMVCENSLLAVPVAVWLYKLGMVFPPSLVPQARHLDQAVAESEDGAEDLRAFKEKHQPIWKGR